MKRLILCLMLTAVALVLVTGCPPESEMSYIDNRIVKVGVELKKGGAITYIAEYNNQNVNLINSADLGRMIQQSYYSGPWPYGNPHPSWPDWGWNPIGAGDCYGNPAEVIDHVNDGATLYVKTIPMQWALDDVPGECFFEQWITLDANAVHVRFKLTNDRADTTLYPACHQELPAVYTTDRFYRLFTYTGSHPYTHGALTEIVNNGPPWTYFNATEKWTALIDDNDWGLGVYNPNAQQFVAGFHGTPGSGSPSGSSTGYIAPLRTEVIEYDTVYEYEAWFILGYLDDIRAYVYQNE